MDWLDRENRKNDAPGTWLFGWFVLGVVVLSFKEAPVVTGIVLVLLTGWYFRRNWDEKVTQSLERERMEKEERLAPADQGT